MSSSAPPLISVIMPVYNGGLFLSQAIESILAQTFTGFELIIINDGSTDSSEKIILSFSDARIKYIRNDNNLGLCKSLNKAIKLSAGKYIARMDQDDIAYQDRFRKQLDFLAANPGIVMVGSAVNIIDQNNKIIDTWRYSTQPEIIKNEIYERCCFAHPSVMLLKSKIEEAGFYNENCFSNEDYDLWIRLLKNNSGANLSEPLLKYRIHEHQMSSNNVLKQVLHCTLIKKQIPVDYSHDLKTQITAHGISTTDIESDLVDTFSFWISLHLKINKPALARELFIELKKQLDPGKRMNKKILNSVELRISLKEKDIFKICALMFRRIGIALSK